MSMFDSPPENHYLLNVRSCARCQQDHDNIMFRPLINAPQDITHFAMCPHVEQPIFMSRVPTLTTPGDNK